MSRSNLKLAAQNGQEVEQTPPEFKDGDGDGFAEDALVMIRSGGPAMTFLGKHPDLKLYMTCWFAGEKLQHGAFPLAALVECELDDD